jgi:hypothetical protein
MLHEPKLSERVTAHDPNTNTLLPTHPPLSPQVTPRDMPPPLPYTQHHRQHELQKHGRAEYYVRAQPLVLVDSYEYIHSY